MRNILYLVHRLPYPPNKGDKVRSFNILKHLASNNNIFLGTFIDDPDDEKYIPIVEGFCEKLFVYKLNKKTAFFRGLKGLFNNTPLSLNYYDVSKVADWVTSIVENNKIDAVFIFSSVMGQFVKQNLFSRTLVDFVDVDSQKWMDYAANAAFPVSILYKHESNCLLRYERFLALKANHSFFVTENERLLFSEVAPESLGKTSALNNGVDSDFFSQDEYFVSPFISHNKSIVPIVFTGAMDYLPNIDAVIWFVDFVLSDLLKINKNFRFFIVGRNPSRSVINLNSEFVFVTGTVKDVRPYLQFAAVVVAPLRIARGVQNKILEAMSMSKVVIASKACVQAIDAVEGKEIISAESASDFIINILNIIEDDLMIRYIASSARIKILEKYSWNFHLRKIDEHLNFDGINI